MTAGRLHTQSTASRSTFSRPFFPISILILTLAVLLALTPSSLLLPRAGLLLLFGPLNRLSFHNFLPNPLAPFTRQLLVQQQQQRPIITMSPYAKELEIAQLAVQRAAILTRAVFRDKAKGTLSKDDKSPVTIGDFGAQALIIAALRANFPGDLVVAEEEAAPLRDDAALREQVWQRVRGAALEDAAAEAALGGGLQTVDDMLDAIDLGRAAETKAGRVWTIDPIDGTQGFLRGGQYAIALALLVDGEVRVGVLGCPNLPVDDGVELDAGIGEGIDADEKGDAGRGVLFAAGIKMRELAERHLAEARLCESFEAKHSNQSEAAQISQKLGITRPSVRMDSQAKYGSVARGAGDIYLRLPTSKTYREKIWDHAAGDLIAREAGGVVTDTLGRRLDFANGRTLASNSGVVVAPAAIHAKVLDAVQEVLGLKPAL
ncbi:hypothetical protein VTJ83DRAFT_7148 [Remersonia thermophila]|uniref:3'(2'),5'-bisphosphate nucleotidase n=1 Tax=Remersonia thermophila TaxID=72144 RepID=A0ABR4D2N2_9PEZI